MIKLKLRQKYWLGFAFFAPRPQKGAHSFFCCYFSIVLFSFLSGTSGRRKQSMDEKDSLAEIGDKRVTSALILRSFSELQWAMYLSGALAAAPPLPPFLTARSCPRLPSFIGKVLSPRRQGKNGSLRGMRYPPTRLRRRVNESVLFVPRTICLPVWPREAASALFCVNITRCLCSSTIFFSLSAFVMLIIYTHIASVELTHLLRPVYFQRTLAGLPYLRKSNVRLQHFEFTIRSYRKSRVDRRCSIKVGQHLPVKRRTRQLAFKLP